MDSFNPDAPNTLQSNSSGPRGTAPADHTGISHPTTYDEQPNNSTGNVNSTMSDPQAAAKMQSNINTPMTNNNRDTPAAPGVRQPIGSDREVPGDNTGSRVAGDSRQVPGLERHEEGRHTEGQHTGAKEKVKDAVGDAEAAEASHKHRKTHEETTREIQRTQEKAMSGTHETSKQGESLRKEVDAELEKGPHDDGLVGPDHAQAQDIRAEEGAEAGGHKPGMKEKLMEKLPGHHAK